MYHHFKKIISKKVFRSTIGLIIIFGFFVLVEYQRDQQLINTTEKMLSLLSEDTDQIMIAKPAQQFDSKLSQTYLAQFPTEMKEVFIQIDTLLMAQKILATSGVENIFVVKPRKGFETQSMVKIISENQGVVYAYKMVDDLYIYFPLGQDFTSNQGNFAKAWLTKDAIQQIANNDFSLMMRQSPLIKTQSPLTNTDYLIASFHITPKRTDMMVSAWFQENQTTYTSNFDPKFTKEIKENTLFYLEVGSIAKFLNLSDNDLQNLIQQRISSSQITLSNDQMKAIINSLKGNIAITLQPSKYSLGLGINISFEGTELYQLLKPLMPMMTKYLSMQASFSGTQTQLLEDENMIGTQLTLPTGEPFIVRVLKTKNSTTIGLGEPIKEGKTISVSPKNNHAFLQFSLSPSSIMQHLQKLQMIGVDASSSQAWLSLLSGDRIQGYIIRQPQKISLIAEQKK